MDFSRAFLNRLRQVGAVSLGALTIALLLSWNAVPVSAEVTNTSFELTDHRGKRLSDKKLRGRHLLIFFGYTYCPDICPVALTNIAEMLDHLGDDANKVKPVFVTLDPERDTPDQLAGYVTHFHPSIIGLTGSEDEIKQVAANYEVTYYKVTEGDEYLINHSGGVYVIDPAGPIWVSSILTNRPRRSPIPFAIWSGAAVTKSGYWSAPIIKRCIGTFEVDGRSVAWGIATRPRSC